MSATHRRRLEWVSRLGTRYVKHVPKHHRVSLKIAKNEVLRWKDILKNDHKGLDHARMQLKNAGREKVR